MNELIRRKEASGINQYLYQKEEETLLKLRMLTGDNFDKYITELQKLKDENTYDLFLPFAEFVVESILDGINIMPDKLNDWWVVYSNTLQYKGESLKYVTNALCYDLSDSLIKAFKVNIFTGFFNWIKNKLKPN